MRSYYQYIVCCLLTIFFATPLLSAKENYGYSEEHPLVIVCDWDFQPFEFLNNDGEPAGYNVEVLDLILNRLEIPHKFVMQEWHLAIQMFERHEADLIHALSYQYGNPPYLMTSKYVNYYNLRVARRMDTPPLPHIRDLDQHDKIVLKQDDYANLKIKEMGEVPFQIEYLSPKEGLTAIHNGQCRYFIWGEIPLSRKIKELSLDSIVLGKIDIPAGELRIIGYRKDIINMIDDEFTRLEQAGDLQIIYDKWFHPERIHDDASPVTLYILAGLFVLGLLVFVLNRLTTMRVKAAVRKSGDLNNMMLQALKMGNYYVIEYDVQTQLSRNIYGNLMPPQGMHIDEFVGRIDPEQQQDFRTQFDKMLDGTSSQWTMIKRWNAGTAEAPQWRNLYGKAIVEKEDGKLRYIVNSVKDITREVTEEQHNQELGSRYMKIFETSLMAMSFYDRKGHLLDLNQKMRELLNFSEEAERYFSSNLLPNIPILQGAFDPLEHEPFHVCHHLFFPDQGLDKYIEFRINPVFDDTDRLVYYVVTCRDVTAERNMILQQREHDRKMKATNASISRYERQLRYLLEESNMYVWQFDINTDVIKFSRTLGKVDFTMSLQEYMDVLMEEEREKANQNFMGMITKGTSLEVIHHFSRTPIDLHPCWYALSGLPTYDAQGKMTGYFGVARNITYLMESQEHLRRETERAENSGLLKSAFLANMTHEIRTPLNAIVGFSSLLQAVETPEERKEFIRIIRNNCDMLLRLINDILEASSMGQSMTIQRESIDLVTVFDDICQTLEQRVAESGVPFVKDNPYATYPAVLDKGRLQQILTNFVTNAVKYTRQGHIKVGYHEERRQDKLGLYFYCEDTGAGIPKEKQSVVFDRFVKLNDFVQGTGLGLSICKAIINRIQGEIGVSSEGEGHGSTFWFWIPTHRSEPID